MADTSGWTLQDFANAAGTRREPYPTCAAPEPNERACPGCGCDLSGRKARNTGLPLIFCSNHCRNVSNRRWRQQPDEAAVLSLHRYSW